MSDHFPALLVADLIGAVTLWRATRAGARYPLAWSVGAWAATAAFATGLVPVQTTIAIAGVTMIVGVGLITPLVGVSRRPWSSLHRSSSAGSCTGAGGGPSPPAARGRNPNIPLTRLGTLG